MQVIDGTGKLLDATYFVEPAGAYKDLIMESRGGSSGGRPARNADYNPALTLLLERLASLETTLQDAWVDSRRTQRFDIPEEDRRIIAASVSLRDVGDFDAFRIRMCRAQADIAMASGAEQGGNRTKRIRLRLAVPGYAPDQGTELADYLALPINEARPLREVVDQLTARAEQIPVGEADAGLAVELDEDLDRLVQARQRREQARLRRVLFTDQTAANCDLCSREFPIELLVAAHIKQRSQCNSLERHDVANVVMATCRLGCDELFERGYICVSDDGAVIASAAVQSSVHVIAYVSQHLAGKVFRKTMAGRRSYFAWHRENRFIAGEPDTYGWGVV